MPLISLHCYFLQHTSDHTALVSLSSVTSASLFDLTLYMPGILGTPTRSFVSMSIWATGYALTANWSKVAFHRTLTTCNRPGFTMLGASISVIGFCMTVLPACPTFRLGVRPRGGVWRLSHPIVGTWMADGCSAVSNSCPCRFPLLHLGNKVCHLFKSLVQRFLICPMV